MASSPFIVVVEFTLMPSASKAEGRQLLVDNAKTSLREESGCFQFDVVEATDDGAPFILYEIYRDEAAFKYHLSSEHYRAFSAQADKIFDGKIVRLGQLVSDSIHRMEESANG